MLFPSTVFLFIFLPIVWLINRFLPRLVSNVFLCIVSLIFYAWGEPVYVLMLIFVVVMNYFLTKGFEQSKHKKARLAVGVTINISTLLVFKYTDFALETVNLLPGIDIPLPGILLPIGISFFIFQATSYLIDVYRGTCKPQQSFIKLLLYISFFPQLMAGPIIYYHDIQQQIDERTVTSTNTALGIRRFIIGLAKKLLIADTLAVAVDAIYALDLAYLTMPIAWVGAIAYMMQLYFDFSGYSDMAIGLGRMFGFKYKENFNYPYIASTMQDFWRRWHISLSGWFKEYVYIPLGGNRKGDLRTVINKVIVFFLTGLWHGAQWTFVVWGLIHGALLLFEQYFKPMQRFTKKTIWIGHVYTLLMVTFTFALFRSESFTQAMAFWGNMVAGSPGLGLQMRLITPMFIAAICAGIVGSLPWVHFVKQKIAGKKFENSIEIASYLGSLVLLLICMLSLAAGTYNPFIYFRF